MWETRRPSWHADTALSSTGLTSQPDSSCFRNQNEVTQKVFDYALTSCMPKKRKVRRKFYTLPSFRKLDAEGAKAALEAKGDPGDPEVQKMIATIEQLIENKKPKSTIDKSA